jgi:competence protein ComEA
MKLIATWKFLCVGAAAVALCLAADNAAKLLPDSPGKETVVRLCTECHGPENFRKVRHDKDEWTDSVADMVDRGAKGTPAELAAVVDYLAQNFGADSKVNVNTAPLQELKAQLDFTVPEALAVIAYRQNSGSFKEWRDLLKVNGVDPQKVEARKEKMAF